MELSEIQTIDKYICGLLLDVKKHLQQHLNDDLSVNTKTSRKDLVTNVDKENEQFLVRQIKSFDPRANIIAEENFNNIDFDINKGKLYVIDPIDGTMNFVKQRNNFSVMIAVYENGVGVLGFILNVMENQLIHGGPALGVWLNERKLQSPDNVDLGESLIGMSGPLVMNNYFNMQAVVRKSLGMRIYGGAGITISKIILGELCGYVSRLKPWDFAAGKVLCETLGIKVTAIDDDRLDMVSSKPVLFATENAHKAILSIAKS